MEHRCRQGSSHGTSVSLRVRAAVGPEGVCRTVAADPVLGKRGPAFGHHGLMHKTAGLRDPAAAFPLPAMRDDVKERRDANRAVAVSAIGLAVTGVAELLVAVLTGSVGLLGDATHNLSDVSTSAVVFLGFRLSRRPSTERYPYGLERAEDLAGIGIAVVIWASAAFAGYESIRKLLGHGGTSHVALGMAGAALGVVGNQVVARYKLVIGKRINSATLIADARHSWLDALSSLGALVGLVAVALGFRWGDPIAGIAVTLFICHVGYQVTGDVVHRLADGVDPAVITGAEASAGAVDGVAHAHARARWTGRTLRVEVEGWVDPDLTVSEADALGRQVALAVVQQVPDIGSFTWTARATPT
jgi:cation diffusion facilitator family transporter